MSRGMLLVLALFVTCFGWFLRQRSVADSSPVMNSQTEVKIASQDAVSSHVSLQNDLIPAGQTADSAAGSSQGSTDALNADQLIAAIHGDNADARSAAITALENAPKAAAVPVLREVLSNGSPPDQERALQSLRSLALDQGDADGGIRNVFREAIYHGSDEAMVNSAQTTLDDVDGALSQNAGSSY
jgi:hypothetical protein